MEFYDLTPTNENVYQTFIDDKIGRNPKVFKFISLINRINSSCSISLDGSWGSGKTIFVKQVKMVLDALNQYKAKSDFTNQQEEAVKTVFTRLTDKNTSIDSIKPHVCVYYDAWENDSDTDPLISLVHGIVKDFSCGYKFEHAPDLGKVAASLAMGFSSAITNVDVHQIFEDCHFTNDLEEFEKTKELEQTISEMLDSLLPEHGDRLIIFIDELDRCKPTFAVKLLERVKHYFTNEKITFVFSTNVKELSNTIKNLYGSNFNADRYLDKFFDLRLSLPPIDISEYLSKLGYREENVILKKIFNDYSFSMREICRFLKIYELAKPSDFAVNSVPYSQECNYGFRILEYCVLPLLIALQITDSQKLSDFINGRNSKPLIDLLGNIHYPYLDILNINSMPIYKEKGEVCQKDVINCLYEKIYNPNFSIDMSKYGNNLNVIEFQPLLVKIIHDSFSLISEFNIAQDKTRK